MKTLWTEYRRQVDITPDKLAVVDGTQSFTYAQLEENATRLAKNFKSNFPTNSSNGPEIVAILLPPGHDYITSLLAVLGSSRVFSPLSVDYPSSKLELMLLDLGNPVLITKSSILSAIGLTYGNSILVHNTLENSESTSVNPGTKVSNENAVNNTNEELNAVAYFTSGSTGIPKAVLTQHSTFLHFIQGSIKYFKLSSTDKSLCYMNPGFLFSGYEIWTSLLSGGTLYIPPNRLRYDIPKLREWIKAKELTVVCMVSSSAEQFFNAGLDEFSHSHRLLLCGGEKLQGRPPVGTPFKVYSLYGSTETLNVAAINITDNTEFQLKNPITHALAGMPFPGVKVYVVDEETLQPVASGEVGEILVSGMSISRTYLNRPTETQKKFFQLNNGIQVCRTGDLGYFLPDGNLVVLNRRDNQVKVSGYRFDLSELEFALLQHSSIQKAVAVVEKTKDLKIHLFYTLKVGEADVSQEVLAKLLQQNLPHYAFPHSLTQVESFPKNTNGKIDKPALLNQISKNRIIRNPVTATEKLVAEIWSSVLEIPDKEVSRHDNFFSLGGTSMSAMKVIAELKNRNTGIELQPFHIFRIPVLKSFAEFLDTKSSIHFEGVKDFEAELKLYDVNDYCNLTNIQPFNPIQKASSYLLTGATGYLGGSLLLELLEQTDANIYCLVRAQTSDEAHERCIRRLNKGV